MLEELRDKVKCIVTDFYSGYIFLSKKLFRNADIIIDRFHIITQVYNALNSSFNTILDI